MGNLLLIVKQLIFEQTFLNFKKRIKWKIGKQKQIMKMTLLFM